VQEGGQWKIDLPDNVDAKQLAQNIQQHLQMAAQSKDQWPADAKAIRHERSSEYGGQALDNENPTQMSVAPGVRRLRCTSN